MGLFVLMRQGRNEPVSVAVLNKGEQPLPLTHKLNGSDPYQHGILEPGKSKTISLTRMGVLEFTLGDLVQELAVGLDGIRNVTALKAANDPVPASAQKKPVAKKAKPPARRRKPVHA
jgi:hypothetical protein